MLCGNGPIKVYIPMLKESGRLLTKQKSCRIKHPTFDM